MSYRSLAIACSTGALLLVAEANAGWQAQNVTTDVVTMTDATPSVGDTLAIDIGRFNTFTPDTPADPQIGSDLYKYAYTLAGTVQSVSGTTASYTGSYTLFYDSNNDDVYVSGTDYMVSSGNAAFDVTWVVNAGNVSISVTAGTLQQTAGPELSPQFADLSYGGYPVVMAGTITIPTSGSPVNGTANLVFTQAQAIPEPAGLSLLAVGGLTLLRRRRN